MHEIECGSLPISVCALMSCVWVCVSSEVAMGVAGCGSWPSVSFCLCGCVYLKETHGCVTGGSVWAQTPMCASQRGMRVCVSMSVHTQVCELYAFEHVSLHGGGCHVAE